MALSWMGEGLAEGLPFQGFWSVIGFTAWRPSADFSSTSLCRFDTKTCGMIISVSCTRYGNSCFCVLFFTFFLYSLSFFVYDDNQDNQKNMEGRVPWQAKKN
jgi:hypothetical protein